MDAVHDLGNGLYFARQDYAGLLRRLIIIVVDLLVIVLVGFLVLVVWAVASSAQQGPVLDFVWLGFAYFVWLGFAYLGFAYFVWLGFAYLYLTLLRGSRLRTLGYILTGVKIVNLKGGRPSFFWMNLRLFLWISGPLNPIVDLLWFWSDENRQMLRDKLAGTYVVRKGAVPVGEGPIVASTLFLLGYTLVYPEVKKPVTVV
jgi:uncharacterized RDD family membrane protein YckC